MGSGGKLDPSQISVADFGDTYNCRLAYVLRKKAEKAGCTWGIQGGFLHRTSSKGNESFRWKESPNKKSTVGTSSYIPAIFGCTLASIVIRDLIEQVRMPLIKQCIFTGIYATIAQYLSV